MGKAIGSTSLRRLATGVLVWVAVTTAAPGALARDQGDTKVIALELNRAESRSDGCRLSFVIHNRTSHSFASLQWDFFFFDRDGLIAGRMAAEAAPLQAGKTSVKLFDVPGLACSDLGRVLLNDVLRCQTAAGGGDPVDCLALTVPSSRAEIELFK